MPERTAKKEIAMKSNDYESIIEALGKLAVAFQQNPVGGAIILLIVAFASWVAVMYFQHSR